MQSTDPTPPLTTSNSTTTSTTSTPGPPTPNAGQKGRCTKDHVRYCMDVLAAHFEGRDPMRPGFSGANDKFAIFVTWNTTRPGHEPRLRGCIGTFTPMPLAEGLKEYALISALKDHRFNPVSATELPSLQCGISILTPTTPISDPLAWTPGIHGIQISFPSPSSSSSSSGRARRLSATYLPEIATDQGWSQEETILSAIQKAGYRGRVVVGDEVWRSLEVGVYESSKAKLDWAEYEAWRAGRV